MGLKAPTSKNPQQYKGRPLYEKEKKSVLKAIEQERRELNRLLSYKY